MASITMRRRRFSQPCPLRSSTFRIWKRGCIHSLKNGLWARKTLTTSGRTNRVQNLEWRGWDGGLLGKRYSRSERRKAVHPTLEREGHDRSVVDERDSS